MPSPPKNPDFYFEDRVVPGYKRDKPVVGFAVPPYNPPPSTHPLEFMMQGQIPTPDAFNEMKKGNTKVAMIIAGNPMVMEPQPKSVREAMDKVEFVVVLDPYMTKTAEIADLVLPAATYVERTEPEWFTLDYGQNSVGLRQQLVTVGEAWPDYQFFIKLGQKLGYTEEFASDDVGWYIDELLKPADLTLQKMKDAGKPIQFAPMAYQKYETAGFSLPGGKANIVSEILKEQGFDPLPVWLEGSESPRITPDIAKDYPFVTFTGRAGPQYVHSDGRTLPWAREITPEARVMIHPDKASELGIADNDWCVVESPRGSIKIRAEVTRVVSPKCLYVPGGWDNANYNDLGIEEDIDPISSQPNYMTCLGRIRKA